MKSNQNILTAKDLSIGYRTAKNEPSVVHQHLTFELKSGELTCLLGPNGAGKSTLLRTLAGSQPLLCGELQINDKPLKTFNEREKSRLIGVVLTDKTQTGGLTVYELVALGRQPHTGFFGRLRADDKQLVAEAMAAVGIAHKATNYMAELSDGERQKAMIAKALVQECPLILLDEPTAFLDVVSRIEIMNLLHEIAHKQKKTILMSTHDIEQALVMSDRLWLLSREQGLISGVTEDVVLSGSMDRLFGRDDIMFDNDHGVYYPRVSWDKQLVVEAANHTLLHWATNALNRHGYACFDRNDVRSNDSPVLRVESPLCLMLQEADGSEPQRFRSFEELLVDL